MARKIFELAITSTYCSRKWQLHSSFSGLARVIYKLTAGSQLSKGIMSKVKLFIVVLLLASVWIFHATMPQKQNAFIPAASDVIKVRQASFFEPAPQVVSLEEAEKRYTAQWGHELPDPYGNYDGSNCWFNDCLLKITIRITVNQFVRNFGS